MNNYKVISLNKSEYNILEKQTDQIIDTFQKRCDARKMAKHLNLGGGFDGASPPFILRKMEPYINTIYENVL